MNSVIEIYEKSEIERFPEFASQVEQWSCGLWWNDFEEAGISKCYFAFDEDLVVGFQTVNHDGLCVAIETHPEYRNQGIASQMVKESNSIRPERNENPEFWDAIEESLGAD